MTKKLKIAVLTFPLIKNYGGILQAYAMLVLLKKLGHEPVLVYIRPEPEWLSLVKFFTKKILLWWLPRFKGEGPVIRSKEIEAFVTRNVTPRTEPLINIRALKEFGRESNFDAWIVGSDQVFATMGYPRYANIYNLGFLDETVCKIAFSASFGGGKFSATPEMIAEHKRQLKKFSAISVREQSGVNLCREVFEVSSTRTMDPTLLIDEVEFSTVCIGSKGQRTPYLFAYLLDGSPADNHWLRGYASSKDWDFMSSGDGNKTSEPISIEQWISAIKNAEFVITDSFHGCVFCIIFEVQFACKINETRGADRFKSLLSDFQLEERVWRPGFTNAKIDWERIRKRRSELKKQSIAWLDQQLSEGVR